MQERTDVWTDTDSPSFLALAEMAVPGRQGQIEKAREGIAIDGGYG